MGEFSGFPLEEKISQLWRSVPDDAEDVYSDRWLEKEYGALTAETGLLAVVSWGPHRKEKRMATWNKVLATYKGIGKPLHKLTSEERDRVVSCYPLKKGWQGKFLRALLLYLGNSGTSMDDLAAKLKEAGPAVARAALQDILDTSSSKIIDCYLRDVLILDAFPIDSHVRRVLKKYSIPADPSALVAVCQRMEIPVRILARATFAMDAK